MLFRLILNFLRLLTSRRMELFLDDDTISTILQFSFESFGKKIDVGSMIDNFRDFEISVDTLYLHSMYREPPVMPPKPVELLVDLRSFDSLTISHGLCAPDESLRGNFVCLSLDFSTDIDGKPLRLRVFVALEMRPTIKFVRPLARQLLVKSLENPSEYDLIDPEKVAEFITRLGTYVVSVINGESLMVWVPWVHIYKFCFHAVKVKHWEGGFTLDLDFTRFGF